MATTRPLKLAVVGLGFGADVHIPAFLSLNDTSVIGVVSRSISNAQKVAEKFQIPHAFSSIEELFRLNLDAISIALPPDEVPYAAGFAISRGVPVLCEKPLGTNVVDSQKLANDARGMVTAVNFTFAELEEFLYLKRCIDQQQFGRIRHVNVLWLTESRVNRSLEWSWKTDSLRSGGAISLMGSHLMYLAEWLFGPISSVNAQSFTVNSAFNSLKRGACAEDTVSVIFRHLSGAPSSFTFGNANPAVNTHRWTVVFEGATLVLENNSADFTNFKLFILEGKSQSEVKFPLSPDGICQRDGRIQPFKRIAKRFIESIKEGKEMKPNFDSGARVQYLDSQLRLSCNQRREINFF